MQISKEEMEELISKHEPPELYWIIAYKLAAKNKGEMIPVERWKEQLNELVRNN